MCNLSRRLVHRQICRENTLSYSGFLFCNKCNKIVCSVLNNGFCKACNRDCKQARRQELAHRSARERKPDPARRSARGRRRADRLLLQESTLDCMLVDNSRSKTLFRIQLSIPIPNFLRSPVRSLSRCTKLKLLHRCLLLNWTLRQVLTPVPAFERGERLMSAQGLLLEEPLQERRCSAEPESESQARLFSVPWRRCFGRLTSEPGRLQLRQFLRR